MTENQIRTEGRVQLAPHQEERLRALMRRSDALGNALDALEGQESAYLDVKAEYVEIVRKEHRQAHEAFVLYRNEVLGPRANARQPA